jgi:hypothetical protein
MKKADSKMRGGRKTEERVVGAGAGGRAGGGRGLVVSFIFIKKVK